MEQVDLSLIVGIIITMVFSAFFSGMEIAFVSSNRMLAEMDKEKNGLTQRLISLFITILTASSARCWWAIILPSSCMVF